METVVVISAFQSEHFLFRGIFTGGRLIFRCNPKWWQCWPRCKMFPNQQGRDPWGSVAGTQRFKPAAILLAKPTLLPTKKNALNFNWNISKTVASSGCNKNPHIDQARVSYSKRQRQSTVFPQKDWKRIFLSYICVI